MSDEKKSISFKDFERYAIAKQLKPVCPMCSTSSWTVIEESDGLSASLTFTNRDTPTIDGAKAAYLTIVRCNNCAFLATFDRGFVSKWLEENNE